VKTETKHFVTFYSPGTLFHEETRREIDSWDTRAATKMAAEIVERHGSKPFGFRFSTSIVVSDVLDGIGGTMPETSKEIAKSAPFYIGGRLRTLAEVEAEEPGSILAWNMRANDWATVVETCSPYRACNVFQHGAVLLDADGTPVARAAEGSAP
jgi:hypothetical protein